MGILRVSVALLLVTPFARGDEFSLNIALAPGPYVLGEPIFGRVSFAAPEDSPAIVLAGGAVMWPSAHAFGPASLDVQSLAEKEWRDAPRGQVPESPSLVFGDLLVLPGSRADFWCQVNEGGGIVPVGRWRCRGVLDVATTRVVSPWVEFDVVAPRAKTAELLQVARDLGVLNDQRWPAADPIDLDRLKDTPYWIWGGYFRAEDLTTNLSLVSTPFSVADRQALLAMLEPVLRLHSHSSFPLWHRVMTASVVHIASQTWYTDADFIAGASGIMAKLQADPDVAWSIAQSVTLAQQARSRSLFTKSRLYASFADAMQVHWWEAEAEVRVQQVADLRQIAATVGAGPE